MKKIIFIIKNDMNLVEVKGKLSDGYKERFKKLAVKLLDLSILDSFEFDVLDVLSLDFYVKLRNFYLNFNDLEGICKSTKVKRTFEHYENKNGYVEKIEARKLMILLELYDLQKKYS